MPLPNLMTSLSMLLNLAVLVPVCASLLLSAPWTVAAYGPPSPARGRISLTLVSTARATARLASVSSGPPER